MQRFMCTHTVPQGMLTRELVEQFAQAAQQDPQVRGYESFINITEGKAVCILDAPDQQTLSNWFQKMGMPVDSISPVELQGERGHIREVAAEYHGAGMSA